MDGEAPNLALAVRLDDESSLVGDLPNLAALGAAEHLGLDVGGDGANRGGRTGLRGRELDAVQRRDVGSLPERHDAVVAAGEEDVGVVQAENRVDFAAVAGDNLHELHIRVKDVELSLLRTHDARPFRREAGRVEVLPLAEVAKLRLDRLEHLTLDDLFLLAPAPLDYLDVLHAGGDEVAGEGRPVDPEDLLAVSLVPSEQSLCAPLVDGNLVLVVLAHARHEVAARREAQRGDSLLVETLQHGKSLHVGAVPHDNLGVLANLAGGEDDLVGMPGHAQDVVAVTLGDVVRLGVIGDVLLGLVHGIVHDANRGGVVANLTLVVVVGVLPGVVPAKAVHPPEK